MEEKKKIRQKGGRPKKDVKRDYTLSVRMTKIERIRIDGKAKKAGLKPTEWFRQAAKSAQVVPRLSPSDIKHLGMLAGLANNLNQLTKMAHIRGLEYLVQPLQKLRAEISDLVEKLFKE